MFAFSAFGQSPHTEYYFILQESGGEVYSGGFGRVYALSGYCFWLQQDLFKMDQAR